jgi:hypothetical protein
MTVTLLGSCYDTPLIADHADDPGSADGEQGGAGAGQAGAGAGQAGQAGAMEVPRVAWLELFGSQAPGSSESNRALGVRGSFYAYSDSCAELSWDESTRCASGKLCDPTLNADAWGMAIGFDFNNTGEDGAPPNAKLTWNPNDVGALGVSWRVTGSAPGLQLWVLNMAPRWQGLCEVMSCEIDGPPDGVAQAPSNGELLFDQLVKDYWGGAGVTYQFDPAAVHALQFKLPAIRVGAASFDFCIEALGIVR